MNPRGRLLAAVLTLAVAHVEVPGAQQPRSEYEIKAAFLYSFGRFVEWPRDARGATEFSICVLGADPFGPALDAVVAGTTVQGRTVVARRVASPSEGAACHVLFIGASEARRVDAIVSELASAQVLTVSDMPAFVDRGGMIQFVTTGGRVRFEIDFRSAQEAGLTMSSDLLRVASAVRRAPQLGN